MKGYTTDGAGCYKALENHGVDCSGRVLLLGNGGAAGPWLSRLPSASEIWI